MKQQVPQEQIATPADTRAFFLKKAGRDFAPLRRDFVQQPRGAASRVGPLAAFVTNGDIRGLNTYLFIVAITSTAFEDTGWSTTINGMVWARALGATESASPPSARSAVTKVLRRLQDRKLITFERLKGTHDIRVTLLREDGSGEPYTRPGAGNSDPYVKIPVAFWLEGLDGTVGMPGLAMLLVASCERRRFELPTERMQTWYGWSPDTAERGFKELSDAKVLVIDKTYKKAPASPKGWAEVNLYSLVKPYVHRRISQAESLAYLEKALTAPFEEVLTEKKP